MTQLLLIRHGQASFGTADYDRLSETGERQARLVGQGLVERGQHVDALIAGDMRRQQHTARRVAEAFETPPEIVTDAAFNEYDADALFAAYVPRVFEDNPELNERRDALHRDARLFQKVFEQVSHHWLAGTAHDHPACEAWPDFTARVRNALDRLHTDYPRDARIAVCTSGGPIAVCVASATEASDRKTLELNWSVYNAAIAELRSTRNGWRLLGFNDIAALRGARDPDLITFR